MICANKNQGVFCNFASGFYKETLKRMKRLVYIITCFLTCVFFATAESKPAIDISTNNHQHEFLHKKVPVLSIALIDINTDLSTEEIDEIDVGEYGFKHFVFLDFDKIISFITKHQSYKSVSYAKSINCIAHTPTIPLYILFHSMIIPSAN